MLYALYCKHSNVHDDNLNDHAYADPFFSPGLDVLVLDDLGGGFFFLGDKTNNITMRPRAQTLMIIARNVVPKPLIVNSAFPEH